MPTRRRYSSIEGCCICGTNSSTEPFVTADKVSQNKKCLGNVLKNCFELDVERKGEWCMSCKEIAKKWLRQGRARRSSTSFKKVVDSKRKHKPQSTRRLSKSIDVKSKEEKTEAENGLEPEVAEQNDIHMEYRTENDGTTPVIEDILSEDENEDEIDIAELGDSFPVTFDSPCSLSPFPDSSSSNAKDTSTKGTQTTFLFPTLTSPQANANKLPFIDLSKWRQEEICCGTIFRGPNGEVLVDPKWLQSSCSMCNRSTQPPTPVQTNKSEEISVFDEKLASLCS